MKKTTVFFYPVQAEEQQVLLEDKFHTILRTRHGRRIYLALELNEEGDAYIVRECEYVDRTRFVTPHKLVTREISEELLPQVLRTELDCCVGKCFIGEESYHFCDPITKEQLLRHARWEERPYILLFLRMGNSLYTCFKNRHRRAISLHVKLECDGDDKRAVILDCLYCDARSKRAGRMRTPHGLVTISFDYSLDTLLEIVNREFEGGFSGIMTADDFQFPDLDRPFCGRI
jgi:hypothetical protein